MPARATPRAHYPRLHRGIERRRRADGRRQHSPGRRHPAAVQDGCIGRDRGKTARLRRRGEQPRRQDPEQDLLSVKQPPRLRQEVDALGAATRYAIQEWPGQPVPGCGLARDGVERRLLRLLTGGRRISERKRMLYRRVHRGWRRHRQRRSALQRPLHGALRGAGPYED
jgi:hypothetical protein